MVSNVLSFLNLQLWNLSFLDHRPNGQVDMDVTASPNFQGKMFGLMHHNFLPSLWLHLDDSCHYSVHAICKALCFVACAAPGYGTARCSGQRAIFFVSDWPTAAKKQKSCPSWRPGLGGTTSGLLHAGLLQAGAKGGSHELPCRDVYLSLLKQPESDEIRLGHLIYRHLRWNEVQSCDKKKEKK